VQKDLAAAGYENEGEVGWGGLVTGNSGRQMRELGEEAFPYPTTA